VRSTIEQSVGYDQMNSLVSSWLRDWYVASGDRVIKEVSVEFHGGLDVARCYRGVATLVDNLGHVDRAFALRAQAVALCEAHVGIDHWETVVHMTLSVYRTVPEATMPRQLTVTSRL